MARILLLRQFEDKKGIVYKADFCDVFMWKTHHLIRPTGLSCSKKSTQQFFERYVKYFSKSIEVGDVPNHLMLAFMYCHAAHECGVPLSCVQQIILEFDGEAVDIFCLTKK